MIGILLAAGFSRRFGADDKLSFVLPDGMPIALSAAQHLIAAVPVSIAVVRPENTTLANMLQSAGLHIVVCMENTQTMADSLATAIRYSARFPEALDGFIIALGDMPYIQPNTILTVANAISAGAEIAMPSFKKQRGHPVGFAAGYRAALEQVSGDEGARSIVKQHAHAVQLIDCDDAGILADIDTPADLAWQPNAGKFNIDLNKG